MDETKDKIIEEQSEKLIRLQADYNRLELDYHTLESEYDTLEGDYTSLRESYNCLCDDLKKILADLQKQQKQIDKINTSIESRFDPPVERPSPKVPGIKVDAVITKISKATFEPIGEKPKSFWQNWKNIFKTIWFGGLHSIIFWAAIIIIGTKLKTKNDWLVAAFCLLLPPIIALVATIQERHR